MNISFRLPFAETNASAAVEWKVQQVDIYGKVFEAFVPVRDPALKQQALETLESRLQVEFAASTPDAFSFTKTLTNSSVRIKIMYYKSIPKGSVVFKLDGPGGNPQTEFSPLHSAVRQPTYYFLGDRSAASKWTTLALKILLTISGTIVMANSLFRLNGMLLLRFMQVMDLINFFDMLNVNPRESVSEVFSILSKLSDNKFLMVPSPMDFSKGANLQAGYRGKLSQKKVSPVLLENQLPETAVLLGLLFIDLLFSSLRSNKYGKRVSNFARSLKFGFVQLIAVEQFFYSSYQLISEYSFHSFEWGNFVSTACAFLSLVVLSAEYAQLFYVGLTGYSRPRRHTPKLQRLGTFGLEVAVSTEGDSTSLFLLKVEDGTHVREFIESDINPKKLSFATARLYNLLFSMRLLVLGISCLLLFNKPYMQMGVLLLYSSMMWLVTLLGAVRWGVFASKWVSVQRVTQETLICLMFVVLTILSVDSERYLLSVEQVVWLSVVMIALLGASVVAELFFFAINFVKSVILAVYYSFKWIASCGKTSDSRGQFIRGRRGSESHGVLNSAILSCEKRGNNCQKVGNQSKMDLTDSKPLPKLLSRKVLGSGLLVSDERVSSSQERVAAAPKKDTLHRRVTTSMSEVERYRMIHNQQLLLRMERLEKK